MRAPKPRLELLPNISSLQMDPERDVRRIYKTPPCYLGHRRSRLPRHDCFLLHPILATESIQPLPFYPHRRLHSPHTCCKFDNRQRRKHNLIPRSRPIALPAPIPNAALHLRQHCPLRCRPHHPPHKIPFHLSPHPSFTRARPYAR